LGRWECVIGRIDAVGLDADGEPIEEILSDSSPGVSTTPAPTGMPERSPTSVYSEDEERKLVEHLRDLGYE
jgi:hypothetical protein